MTTREKNLLHNLIEKAEYVAETLEYAHISEGMKGHLARNLKGAAEGAKKIKGIT